MLNESLSHVGIEKTSGHGSNLAPNAVSSTPSSLNRGVAPAVLGGGMSSSTILISEKCNIKDASFVVVVDKKNGIEKTKSQPKDELNFGGQILKANSLSLPRCPNNKKIVFDQENSGAQNCNGSTTSGSSSSKAFSTASLQENGVPQNLGPVPGSMEYSFEMSASMDSAMNRSSLYEWQTFQDNCAKFMAQPNMLLGDESTQNISSSSSSLLDQMKFFEDLFRENVCVLYSDVMNALSNSEQISPSHVEKLNERFDDLSRRTKDVLTVHVPNLADEVGNRLISIKTSLNTLAEAVSGSTATHSDGCTVIQTFRKWLKITSDKLNRIERISFESMTFDQIERQLFEQQTLQTEIERDGRILLEACQKELNAAAAPSGTAASCCSGTGWLTEQQREETVSNSDVIKNSENLLNRGSTNEIVTPENNLLASSSSSSSSPVISDKKRRIVFSLENRWKRLRIKALECTLRLEALLKDSEKELFQITTNFLPSNCEPPFKRRRFHDNHCHATFLLPSTNISSINSSTPTTGSSNRYGSNKFPKHFDFEESHQPCTSSTASAAIIDHHHQTISSSTTNICSPISNSQVPLAPPIFNQENYNSSTFTNKLVASISLPVSPKKFPSSPCENIVPFNESDYEPIMDEDNSSYRVVESGSTSTSSSNCKREVLKNNNCMVADDPKLTFRPSSLLLEGNKENLHLDDNGNFVGDYVDSTNYDLVVAGNDSLDLVRNNSPFQGAVENIPSVVVSSQTSDSLNDNGYSSDEVYGATATDDRNKMATLLLGGRNDKISPISADLQPPSGVNNNCHVLPKHATPVAEHNPIDFAARKEVSDAPAMYEERIESRAEKSPIKEYYKMLPDDLDVGDWSGAENENNNTANQKMDATSALYETIPSTATVVIVPPATVADFSAMTEEIETTNTITTNTTTTTNEGCGLVLLPNDRNETISSMSRLEEEEDCYPASAPVEMTDSLVVNVSRSKENLTLEHLSQILSMLDESYEDVTKINTNGVTGVDTPQNQANWLAATLDDKMKELFNYQLGTTWKPLIGNWPASSNRVTSSRGGHYCDSANHRDSLIDLDVDDRTSNDAGSELSAADEEELEEEEEEPASLTTTPKKGEDFVVVADYYGRRSSGGGSLLPLEQSPNDRPTGPTRAGTLKRPFVNKRPSSLECAQSSSWHSDLVLCNNNNNNCNDNDNKDSFQNDFCNKNVQVLDRLRRRPISSFLQQQRCCYSSPKDNQQIRKIYRSSAPTIFSCSPISANHCQGHDFHAKSTSPRSEINPSLPNGIMHEHEMLSNQQASTTDLNSVNLTFVDSNEMTDGRIPNDLDLERASSSSSPTASQKSDLVYYEWDDYKPPAHSEVGQLENRLDDSSLTEFGDDYRSWIESGPTSARSDLSDPASTGLALRQHRTGPVVKCSKDLTIILRKSKSQLKLVHRSAARNNGKNFNYLYWKCQREINNLKCCLLDFKAENSFDRRILHSAEKLLNEWENESEIVERLAKASSCPENLIKRAFERFTDSLRFFQENLISARNCSNSASNTASSIEETLKKMEELKELREKIDSDRRSLDEYLKLDPLSTCLELKNLDLYYKEAAEKCDSELKSLEELRTVLLDWKDNETSFRDLSFRLKERLADCGSVDSLLDGSSSFCSSSRDASANNSLLLNGEDITAIRSDIKRCEDRLERLESVCGRLASVRGRELSLKDDLLADCRRQLIDYRNQLTNLTHGGGGSSAAPQAHHHRRGGGKAAAAAADAATSAETTTAAVFDSLFNEFEIVAPPTQKPPASSTCSSNVSSINQVTPPLKNAASKNDLDRSECEHDDVDDDDIFVVRSPSPLKVKSATKKRIKSRDLVGPYKKGVPEFDSDHYCASPKARISPKVKSSAVYKLKQALLYSLPLPVCLLLLLIGLNLLEPDMECKSSNWLWHWGFRLDYVNGPPPT